MCSWQDPQHAWLGMDEPLILEVCSTIHLGIARFAVALSGTVHVCAGRVRDGPCVLCVSLQQPARNAPVAAAISVQAELELR